MKLVLGCDHGGFAGKEFVRGWLQKAGHEVVDFGCHSAEAVDYPDVAQLVAEAVVSRRFDKGILLDGFGGAVCLAANKVPGARAVAAYDSVSARFAAAHEDANILCLGAKTRGELALCEILRVFFSTEYEGGRHDGRLAKIAGIERRYSR
ncbi:MAG: RpiB/LacA/LacB family sugar-phosphate isomerase [Elusimicrobia bacterium]|nr:RpiB/LacA/LacB family sugar-phosphate isomerase [Elusimicrobiota bacterium]MDE2236333.1 RpiB/LacA/LacB family sugar-phosphate isomerase [Elusimicrobiota bacterium]MDE2426488.1 RpiB/LacA/LacB family sugar-phosphate isomerase [Elusimicrobiota bacterium]